MVCIKGVILLAYIANRLGIFWLEEDLDSVHDKMRCALKIGGRLWVLAQAFDWDEVVIFFPEISAKKFTDKVQDVD